MVLKGGSDLHMDEHDKLAQSEKIEDGVCLLRQPANVSELKVDSSKLEVFKQACLESSDVERKLGKDGEWRGSKMTRTRQAMTDTLMVAEG